MLRTYLALVSCNVVLKFLLYSIYGKNENLLTRVLEYKATSNFQHECHSSEGIIVVEPI